MMHATTKKILYKEGGMSSRSEKENKSISKSIGCASEDDIDERSGCQLFKLSQIFSQEELDQLAADIEQHGIVVHLIVRRSDSERS